MFYAVVFLLMVDDPRRPLLPPLFSGKIQRSGLIFAVAVWVGANVAVAVAVASAPAWHETLAFGYLGSVFPNGDSGVIPTTHRQVRLAARPVGYPRETDFRLVESAVPAPGAGEFLVRAVYLSLDPYMRGRMTDARSYVPPVALGDVMEGGVVGEVVVSNHPGFPVGDVVEGRFGWQEYTVSAGKGIRRIDPTVAPISTALGVLGMPGLTAYFGLLEVGQPKPGETVVVSAASGAVGGLVGQIAKLRGCRAVGLAGSDAKVAYITQELGYDAGINYRTASDLDEALRAACPRGIDVYFDNVGGRITEAVSRHVNLFARFAVCGLISQYNLTEPELAPRNERFILVNRVRIQGFIVFDFAARYKEGLAQLGAWVRDGKLKYREDVVEGLERAPAALIGLLQGRNFGKMLVRVGPEPQSAEGSGASGAGGQGRP